MSNALRLNLFSIRGGKEIFHEEKSEEVIIKNNESEEKTMELILKVEGMMCPRCEAHVKKALERLEGVAEAVASHQAGTVRITLSAPVDAAVLKQAIEEEGYTVVA